MSNRTPSDATDDSHLWRQKYLENLQQLELTETRWQEYAEALKKGLSRMSIAAQGVDGQLDPLLEKLRKSLRDDNGSKLLTIINDIGDCALNIETNRASYQGELQQTLTRLVEPFEVAELPSKAKKRFKSFSKASEQPPDYLTLAPMLREYHAALVGAMEDIGGILDKSKDKKSFWSRLSSGADEQVLTTVVEAPAPEKLKAEETIYVAPESSPDIDLMPLVSDIESLANAMGLPDAEDAAFQSCLSKLPNPVEVKDLENCLQLLLKAMRAAEKQERASFENFVQSLERQVGIIDGFISQERSRCETSHEDAQSLDSDVRVNLAQMEASIHDSNNLRELKGALEHQLSEIVVRMERYKDQEEIRYQEAKQQIETLETQIKESEKEVQDLRVSLVEQQIRAERDPLTRLPNRNAYEERLQQEVARWERLSHPLCLAVADIDKFKSLNDTYGHLAGDKVIKAVAKTLRSTLRKTDFVARYGGEEFVILMPESNLKIAEEVANRLREAVEKIPFHFNKGAIKVTLSFGVTKFCHQESPQQVFERADKYLYEAKEKGRNRVIAAE